MKIKYNDFDTKIHSISIENKNKDINIKDIKDILSKEPAFKCSECQKIISSFEFFLKINAKEIIICNDCHSKLIEKETERNYISFDRYISTCERHEKKYELFCIDCNRNICSGCKENHTLLGQKHEVIVYDNILVEKELKEKANICNKVKSLSQIYNNISIIKLRENKLEESKRYQNISERFSRENKYAEIIISTLYYFLDKKALCYEIISNFNEIKFNKLLDNIDIKLIFDTTNQILEPSFHIIMESSDMTEKNRIKIIPISERNRINTKISLGS
jgi:DNA-directed RNA polymerase subunit RPC12/RpoP